MLVGKADHEVAKAHRLAVMPERSAADVPAESVMHVRFIGGNLRLNRRVEASAVQGTEPEDEIVH